MNEADFISLLRAQANHTAARSLIDDCAVLDVGSTRLVLSHDALVESVHFLPDDPPEQVAWKLVAVNLSDLAAKGATPLGALLGYTLCGADDEWDARFARGLSEAMATFGLDLLGGDTVRGNERHLAMTVIGQGGTAIPSRNGARPGDAIFVTGTIGDAGAGLALAKARASEPRALLDAYRRPQPQLAAGCVLALSVTAMMDVSDGLLIDLSRMAEASGCAARLDLDAIPLSSALIGHIGDNRTIRLAAASAGDDYQLLLTSALPLPSLPCPVSRIGRMERGAGLHLHDRDGVVPVPDRLGWLHSAALT